MTDPYEIESATSGGGDFIPKDKFMAWAEAGLVCLARILRIDPKGTMLPGFSNPCDPVTVDLLVLADPPVVYTAEQLTNNGVTRGLRTKEVSPGTFVDRQRGQLVAGRFGSYKDSFGQKRPAINPATADDLARLRALAQQHGDLIEHFNREQMARAAAAAAALTGPPADQRALNGHAATPVLAGAPAVDDLPF